jgi:hypothetical protein
MIHTPNNKHSVVANINSPLFPNTHSNNSNKVGKRRKLT